MRFNFTVRKLGDDNALNSSVGQAFVDEIREMLPADEYPHLVAMIAERLLASIRRPLLLDGGATGRRVAI